MKIQFLILSPQKENVLDPTYPERAPMGGSETAALKLFQAFQSRGHDVEIITDYEKLRNDSCDIFIALRVWGSFLQGIRPGKLNYLWCQDDADQPLFESLKDPQIAQIVWSHCDGILMISHYQIKKWHEILKVPLEKVFLTQNGIVKRDFTVRAEDLLRKPRRAYYASTPFRGLNVLLELWPMVQSFVPDVELDIMSSMGTYQQPEKDSPYEFLFEKARQMKGVRYQPGVSQKELRQIAKDCRVLAYPCIFPETGCIAAMEAMASGCVVVGTSIGALPETAWRNPLFAMEGDWMTAWIWEVARLMTDDDYYLDMATQNLHLSSWMDWELIANRWIRQFTLDFSKKGIRISSEISSSSPL